MKWILITGANKGIGLATAKKLLESYNDTYVLLGSRDLTRGKQALENLLKRNHEFKDRIYLVQIDVEHDDSVMRLQRKLEKPSAKPQVHYTEL